MPVSIKPYNTFGIDAKVEILVHITQEEQLVEVLKNAPHPRYILGGGSNLLIKNDLNGIVLKNEIKGVELVEETEEEVIVSIGGGENWHAFVLLALESGWFGIENLSLIPGTVGASPIQNIGAYGVELESVFEKLEAIHLKTGESKIFHKEDCQFGYRDSVFKNELKGEYFITRVFFRLSKIPAVNVQYGAIQTVLSENGITNPHPKDVSNAVIQIRQSKLPDPVKIGNSGSFFKNPVISITQFEILQQRFPHIVSYPVSDTEIKVPAGWLIDQAGWKGRRIGNTGTHKNQALVLVNHGNATGSEIWQLALDIQASVFDKFGIEITPEVNVWGE